jgi:hypothetical protein
VLKIPWIWMLHNDALWCHTFVLDFESAPSWSVNYNGKPYADARKLDGVWWFRSPIGDRNILRFPIQDHVVPLFENPTVRIERAPQGTRLLGPNITLNHHHIFRPHSSERIMLMAYPAKNAPVLKEFTCISWRILIKPARPFPT